MSVVESRLLQEQENERRFLEAREKALAQGKEPFDITSVPFELIRRNFF